MTAIGIFVFWTVLEVFQLTSLAAAAGIFRMSDDIENPPSGINRRCNENNDDECLLHQTLWVRTAGVYGAIPC